MNEIVTEVPSADELVRKMRKVSRYLQQADYLLRPVLWDKVLTGGAELSATMAAWMLEHTREHVDEAAARLEAEYRREDLARRRDLAKALKAPMESVIERIDRARLSIKEELREFEEPAQPASA